MSNLIMVMGLPGSGKTYFAKAITNKLIGLHINSDIVRKELNKSPQYSSKEKQNVYEAMFDRVCHALKQGKTVVVDATFSKQKYRVPYLDFTQENHFPCHVILIEANEGTIAKRLVNKRPDSDADYEVYKKIKAEFEPVTINHLALQSEKPLDKMIKESLDYINMDPNLHDRRSNSSTS